MDRLLCGLVCGALTLLPWPRLPSALWVVLIGIGALLLLWHRRLFLAGVLLGFGWSLLFFQLQLHWLETIGRPNELHTITASLKDVISGKSSTHLVVEVASLDGHPLFPRPLMRLGWYQAPAMPASDSTFSAQVRIKPAHGFANPGGFSLESWLLGQGITATGSVRSLRWLQQAQPSWRERWLQLARSTVTDLSQGPLLLAMVFGEQGAVSPESWAPLREAGIIHLIAISGMHIGLAAAMGLGLGRLLLLLPWLGRAGNLPIWCGLLLAFCYTALSGFSLPATRSLLMLLLWLLLHLWQRRWSGWRIWWLTLALMLLFDPWAMFNCGFWLSFMAIGLLWIAMTLWYPLSLWRLQMVMALGLLPLQLWWFEGISLIALPVNLLAIPFFCLLLIPVGLVGGLLLPLDLHLAHHCFALANWLLQQFLDGLSWLLTALDGWCPLGELSMVVLCLLWLAMIFSRLPAGHSLLWLTGFALLLLWLEPAPQWEVLVIDVGQGLSVLVRQEERALLFDTGDARGDFTLVKRAILPLLQHEAIHQLDYLVISHNDRDHAGDWQSVANAYPLRQLISSAPLSPLRKPCLAGQSWRWRALRIEVLSPQQPGEGSDNADSCVLRIGDGRHALLLTGDLPDSQESRLLLTRKEQLRADWLVSGHHGSRHSSSAPFIAAVSPVEVIHSSGYGNRWGFPNPQTVTRFGTIRQWNTAYDGMVRISVWPEQVVIGGYRQGLGWYRDLDAWLGRGEPLE